MKTDKSKTTMSQWDLTPLFKGDNDSQMKKYRKIVEKESYRFINKWKDRTDYLKNPAVLKTALDEFNNWMKNYAGGGRENYYFWLRSQQDQNNPELKAKLKKIDDFAVKIQNEIQFFYLRIAKIPQKSQKKFLEYKGLNNYRHFLERTFEEAKHLLSEPEERLMNLKAGPSYENWVKMTSAFLAKEEREVISEDKKKKSGHSQKKSFSEIMSLINNKNKAVRDSAALALNDILNKYVDVAENEMNSILENKKVNDELRKFPRPDSSRHLGDDLDSKIVDTLSEAVSKRFKISQKYYQLKAQLMGVKKLEYHERNVSYGEVHKKYSYQEAVELVSRVFKNLDNKFFEIFQKFAKNRRIDVYPKKGKEDGAFCVHATITTPTYILLNHSDDLKSVITLAHELGHGINNELMKEKQNAINFGTVLSTAEVASTFMEDFVLRELEKEADDETRLALMMEKLNDDVSTIFRQIACYRFEQELHKIYREKGYLSKEEIGKLFQKHMASYMGDSVKQSEGSQNWWVYWGHIRRFFYNYSYANGLLISKYLQAGVRKNPEFIEKVKDFLSTGLSDSPKNIFKKMDINMADKKFWDQGLDEVESLLKEAEKLAKKLGKI